MIQSEYEKLFRLQETYWWFKGKKYLVRTIMDSLYARGGGLRILDVGCGTGYISKMLQDYGHVTGVDMSDLALDLSVRNGLANVKKGSIDRISFANGEFDVVCVLDVLYHRAVADDEAAMAEVFRVLKPGGRVLVTTSAMKCLVGKNDIVQHGARRHSRAELLAKLSNVGFVHERSSYYTVLFFPFVYVVRKVQNYLNVEAKSDIDEEMNPIVNAVLFWWFKREIDLLRFVRYPFGVHLFALAYKPSL